MDQYLRDRIHTIATDTRYWVEEKAQQSDCPQYDKETLCGWCAIAAGELFNRLEDAGIEAVIIMWESPVNIDAHCYIRVDDHIVDITATQFREYKNSPVLILHEREAEVHDYHTGDLEFACTLSLREYQKSQLWPSSQTVFA